MIEHLDDINDIPNPADHNVKLVTLTKEQIEAARLEAIAYATPTVQILTPHFVLYVKDQVTKMCQKGLFAAPEPIPATRS